MFNSIATQILNQRSLLINQRIHKICEIEMYFNNSSHPDPYVHCHPDQSTTGFLGFHRASNKEGVGYKSGTYKGLDLTLGSPGTYFGVLIRSIIDPEGNLIHGPCCVVNYILKSYGIENIDELVGSKTMLNFASNFRGLTLIENNDNKTIYCGSRIGLDKTKYPLWVDLKYRFTTLNTHIKQCTTLVVM